MALINCPECGTEASNQAVACPKCGFPVAGPKSTSGLLPTHIVGWLWFPAIWLPLMLFRTVRDMGTDGDSTVYDLLGTSESLTGWMSLLQLMMLFLFVVSIYRFLRRRRSTPQAVIAVASIQIVWTVLFLTEMSRALGDTGAKEGLERMWLVLAMAVLIICYFVRSKRVKETFVT